MFTNIEISFIECLWIALALLTLTLIVTLFVRKFRKKKIKENYSSGELRRYFYLKKGEKHGIETVFYKSGKINKTKRWNNGILEGSATTFYQDGEKYIIEEYDRGELVNCDIYDTNGKKIK